MHVQRANFIVGKILDIEWSIARPVYGRNHLVQVQ
jgi:hypothetical protein